MTRPFSAFLIVGFGIQLGNSVWGAQLEAIPQNPEFRYQLSASVFRSGIPVDMSPFRVWYASDIVDGRHRIQSRYLYRKYLDGGQPVAGIAYYVGDPFHWAIPRLSIHIANTTKRAVELVAIDFDVGQSTEDKRAVPVFRAFSRTNTLTIENFGWGALRDVQLSYGIVDNKRCESPEDKGGSIELQVRKYASIDTVLDLDLSKEVPPSLAKSVVVCVVGVLMYSDISGSKHRVPYATGVNTVPPGPGAPSPPTDDYLLELEAGKTGKKIVSIAQKVAPNDVDHFLVRVLSDKSAFYRVQASVRNTEGLSIDAGAFDLQLFVPRGRSGRLSYEGYDVVSLAAILPEAIKKYFARVTRHPNLREIAIFPTKEYFLAKDSERESAFLALQDSLRKLDKRPQSYCIIKEKKCIESGGL